MAAGMIDCLLLTTKQGKRSRPPCWQGSDATFSPLLPLGAGKPQPNTQCVQRQHIDSPDSQEGFDLLPCCRRSAEKAATPFRPASCQGHTEYGPFIGPARDRRKLKANIVHEKRGIFACRSKKMVWRCISAAAVNT